MAGGVQVSMDNVALVAFERPVATIYLGNPSIADVTVIDSRHVFVLGKRYGTTNLIALSADKSVIADDPVTVSSRTAGAVTIFRGPDTFNYGCTQQRCETNPMPGDPDGSPYFDTTQKERDAHEQEAAKAASGGGQQSGGVH